MSDDQTALIVVPRAELVLAEKKAAEQVKRADINGWKSLGIGLLGGAGALGLIVSSHIIMPLIIGGMLLDLCGLGGMIHYKTKEDEYKNQQAAAKAAQEQERTAAEAARIQALRLAAESVLMRNTGAYVAGQEVRVESPGETPKILRIELIGAGVNDEGSPVRKIFANLYEAVSQSGDGLKRGERVANLPEIVCSVPLEPPPASGSEKKLPSYAPGSGS